MKLVAIAALIAVCGAAKLDRTYLPPASAATAGGDPDALQTPLIKTSEQSDVDTSGALPTGSYTNNFQGVVVEAAGAGTRASPDGDFSGLGGPRPSYGSENSKVGDAAFRGSMAGFRTTPFGFNGQATPNGQSGFDNNAQKGITSGQNFGVFENKSERPQAFKDRNSNIISYANDVSLDNYSYGFETDNGIAVGENGVAKDGIQAQGGYSYKGDDGQVYKVTYVADEGGYRPQGDHLPTPPPIPKEILESLEKNAKEEAAGLVDDGSYDPQKYNAEGDYTHHNGGNIQYNSAQSSQFAKRPGSDASASNILINQNNQAINKPEQFGNAAQNLQSYFNGQSNNNGPSNQFASFFGTNQIGFTGTPQKESSQALNKQQLSSTGYNHGLNSGSQFGQAHGVFGSQNTHFGAQNNQQVPVTQFESQSSQFTSQSAQQQPKPQFGQSSFGSQFNQQSFNQVNGQSNQDQAQPGTSFGTQPNRPAFGSNTGYNTQTAQNVNQGLKPQGPFGPEYLPPFNSNNGPSYRPQSNGVSTAQSTYNNQASGIVSQDKTQASTPAPQGSSFTSFNQVGYKPQGFNGMQNQPSQPNQFSNNGQFQSNGLQTSSQPMVPDFSGASAPIKPTSIPNTELTTPLEPNEKSAFSQNTQFISQTTPGIEQSVKNQEQPQVGFQNNADSRPQGSSQFDSSSPAPAIFSTTVRPEEEKPQQNFIQQNQQNNGYYSTQKPSFSQGPDDSYYYNQPSRPFGTPIRPQGSPTPNRPTFQSNGPASTPSNQYFNQQGSQSIFNQNPSSVVPASPTPSSQFTQNQSSYSTNYNGITQAEISPFPSVSPTTAAQYDTTQPDRFGSKPNVPSFPSKPTFGQIPSNSNAFTQTQNQFGQSSSNNNGQVNAQSFSSKPNSFGQSSTSFTQNQFMQSTTTNKDQPQNSEMNQEQETLTQQYNGTLYEYNKPPPVLPESEETDSSASQSTQTDSSSKPENQDSDKQDSKPQFGTQQTQTSSSQNSFASQSHSGPLSSVQAQFGQNTQSNFAQSSQVGQVNKPNAAASYYGQSATNFGFKPQSNPPQYGQNTQQQTQGAQYGAQPFKPFGGAQRPTQFAQNTQTTFDSSQNNKFNIQQTTPFGSRPSSQFSQNFGNAASSQTAQPAKPFGVASQEQQGYPSSKPEVGSQLHFPADFIQNSQQNFGSSQINSQSTNGASGSVIPGSPVSLKPHFGQNQQGFVQPSTIGQQTHQAAQYDQAAKPQFGAQAQYGQNQNAGVNPFGSASSQAQVGPNTAQASSSAVSQHLGVQSYKPFSTSGINNFQSPNKPQFDQAPQTSQGVSSTISPPQYETQPFSSVENQATNQPKVPCCKSNPAPGSAIAPLNVGKPSQAFAQTQSQFTGFQGAQGFNAQSLAGKGEEFGGPRQPPSFDAQTGYHY